MLAVRRVRGPTCWTRLRWLGDVLGPRAPDRGALRPGRWIDDRAILGQMLRMGDRRRTTATAPARCCLLRELTPCDGRHWLVNRRDVAATPLRLVGGNDHFFLNLAMPGLQARARRGPRHRRLDRWSWRWPATARTSASRSRGTGDEWFTGPAQVRRRAVPRRLRPDDANPDIGDSAITGDRRASAGSRWPAPRPSSGFVGGSVARRDGHHPPDARDHARREPVLVDPGPGVPGDAHRDRRDQCRAGPASSRRSTPVSRAGVAGLGQVGAGLGHPPAVVFPAAAPPAGRAGAGIRHDYGRMTDIRRRASRWRSRTSVVAAASSTSIEYADGTPGQSTRSSRRPTSRWCCPFKTGGFWLVEQYRYPVSAAGLGVPARYLAPRREGHRCWSWPRLNCARRPASRRRVAASRPALRRLRIQQPGVRRLSGDRPLTRKPATRALRAGHGSPVVS